MCLFKLLCLCPGCLWERARLHLHPLKLNLPSCAWVPSLSLERPHLYITISKAFNACCLPFPTGVGTQGPALETEVCLNTPTHNTLFK